MEHNTEESARYSYKRLVSLNQGELQEMVSGDPEKAAPLVEAAAKLGFVDAQLTWAQMLLDGVGTSRNPEAAFRWFGVAAVSRRSDAINMLGRCHELGWGCAVNYAEAAALYKQAAAQGDDWAQFNLATLMFSGAGVVKDLRGALRHYVRAARQGNGKAMTVIGRYREEGWVTRQSVLSARKWYERAAKRGDFRAHYALASLASRDGMKAQALVHFEHAIEGAFPAFCRGIATGMLTDPDDEMKRLGRRALERACEGGNPDDFRRLARALEEGIGGPADAEAAAAWRGKADAPRLEPAPRVRPRGRRRPWGVRSLSCLLVG